MNHPIKTFDSLPQAARVPVPLRAVSAAEPRAVPLVGVIRNPRSFRNKGLAPDQSARAEVITEATAKRKELFEVLARFASAGIDYLVIDGGDGTVRDVLTCGASAFGDDWPPLIVMPKGKTNALAADLGLPQEWNLDRALKCAEAGSFARRHPMVIAEADDPQARVQGFMLGAGVFTRSISLGQSAHRWGAFNSLAVAGIPLVTALGIASAIGVVVAVLASVSLLPAFLGLVKHRIRWASVPKLLSPPHVPGQGMWHNWSGVVRRHPVIISVISLACLVPLIIPVFSLELGQEDVGATDPHTTERKAYDLITEGFGVGYNGPLQVASKLDPVATQSAASVSPRRMASTPSWIALTPEAQAVDSEIGDPLVPYLSASMSAVEPNRKRLCAALYFPPPQMRSIAS